MESTKFVLFDLDNVLYNSPKLAEETEKLITAFFRREQGYKDDQEIEAQKKRYFDQYGLVLKGLLKDHPDLDVDLYLKKVDGSLPLDKCLSKDKALRRMLESIRPGIKKLVLTNAAKGHVERTTHVLGIDDCFDDIIDIFALGTHTLFSRSRLMSNNCRTANFNPKPQRKAFELALDRCRKWAGAGDDLRPQECMLIDDNLETIKTAKAMGFQTLWIHPGGDSDDDEHDDDDVIQAKQVHDLPRVCPRLFQHDESAP